MRTAKLTLHRKICSEAECICGAKMVFVERNGWVCPVQLKLSEVNMVDVCIYRKRWETMFDFKNMKGGFWVGVIVMASLMLIYCLIIRLTNT